MEQRARVTVAVRAMVRAAAVMVVAGCTAAPVAVDAGSAPAGSAAVAAAAPTRHLYVVAHEDDDLLFMNPDLTDEIRAGHAVETVFLTAGDAGAGTAFWMNREAGIRAAYAYMSGVPDAWTESSATAAGKRLVRFTLEARPTVTVEFLRLPDGNIGGGGFGHGSLLQLWDGPADGTLAALDADGDPARIVTRGELVMVLVALMRDQGTEQLHTLDATGLYSPSLSSGDHSDHVISARLALDASLRYAAPHGLSMYRTYNLSGDPVNLSLDESIDKREIYKRYDAFYGCAGAADLSACLARWDSFPGDYGAWMQRISVVRSLRGMEAPLALFGSRCLDRDGASPRIEDCTGAASQRWRLTLLGELRGGGELCLAVEPGSGAATVATCDGTPEQQWRVLGNGQVRGLDGCLEPQDGAGAAGTPVGVGPCAQAERQLWAVQLGAPRYASSGGAFGDGDLGDAASSYRSVRLADIDGDGRADACARRSDGIYCAINGGTGDLGPPVRFHDDFSDAVGWSPPQYGTTLAMGDLDADGDADLCGRGYAGVYCVRSEGAQLAGFALWTSSFSDATEVDDDPSYYGALRLGDVDGDGYADLCVRRSDGVHCARNTRAGSFADAVRFTTEFSDALGWRAAAYGATLQLADVDGDGRADLCGRGAAGVICALASPTGTAFERPHAWSFQRDFSDDAGWGSSGYPASIRLADIDGDGRADVCGRHATGIACAVSNGRGFGPLRPMMPREFTDAQGWLPDRYGSTFQLADLDGDARPDLCGRGIFGLLCVAAPAPAP